MKQRIVPGGELDTLTPDELRGALFELIGGAGETKTTIREEAQAATDASGNVTVIVWNVPAAMEFRLTRVHVADDAHDYTSPFNAAGAAVKVLRNDVPVDGRTLDSAKAGFASLPADLNWSESQAPHYSNGDQVAVQLVAAPASTGITVRIQGELVSLPKPGGNGSRAPR